MYKLKKKRRWNICQCHLANLRNVNLFGHPCETWFLPTRKSQNKLSICSWCLEDRLMYFKLATQHRLFVHTRDWNKLRWDRSTSALVKSGSFFILESWKGGKKKNQFTHQERGSPAARPQKTIVRATVTLHTDSLYINPFIKEHYSFKLFGPETLLYFIYHSVKSALRVTVLR